VQEGDALRLDLCAGTLRNETAGRDYRLSPVPDHLLAMAEAGGLVAQLRQRFAIKGPDDAHA
jgi:hypothetical protein